MRDLLIAIVLSGGLTFGVGLVATALLAQVTETTQLEWGPPVNITTVEQALTFEPRLYVDALPAVVVTGQRCEAFAPGIVCRAPVPPESRTVLNMAGTHSMTISLYRADTGEGEKSPPFPWTAKPGAPGNLRLIP